MAGVVESRRRGNSWRKPFDDFEALLRGVFRGALWRSSEFLRRDEGIVVKGAGRQEFSVVEAVGRSGGVR